MKKAYRSTTVKILLIFSLFTFHFSPSIAQHYVFYGVASSGGSHNDGLVYRYDPISGKYDTLTSLDATTGTHAWAGLTLATNGLLYGVTEDGGSKNFGTMFSYNHINNKINVLINCDSMHTGAYAAEGNCVMQASNGLLYGTREVGGSHDSGILYSYNIITEKDSILLNFNKQSGAFPCRTVVEDTSTGFMYGTTEKGGVYGTGVIYRYDPKTNKDTVVFNFDSVGENGTRPVGSTLLLASNGLFYGLTAYGGAINDGTLYSFNPKTFKDTTLIRFRDNNGWVPWISNLMQINDSILYGMTISGGTNTDGVLFNFNVHTNKQSILVNFNGANGNQPVGDLVQDPDNGKLYGVTDIGGSNNMGVLFCYNPITFKDSVVVNFTGANGAYPALQPTLVKDTPNMVNEVNASKESIKVYPNPNNGVFTIESSVASDKLLVEIYNMLGEQVYYQFNIHNPLFNIDLGTKSSGVYLYRVITEAGDLISEGKFIIEKE